MATINMLVALKEKASKIIKLAFTSDRNPKSCMQNHIDSLTWEMETIEESHMTKLRNGEHREMEHAFDGLISRLDTAEERIQEHEDKSTETTLSKNKEKNRGEKEESI